MMRIKRLLLNGLCLAILFCAWPMMSLAGAINLPQTGQTTCYDAKGNAIHCEGTGQEGAIQAGVDWPQHRFEDNGNGTITDHLTGLIWLKSAYCLVRTWRFALSGCNELASGSCGLSDGSVVGDWRLPNVVELESLVNVGAYDNAEWLMAQGFTEVAKHSNTYWTSTTLANNSRYAWVVNVRIGTVVSADKSMIARYVWPVRGGR